MNVGIVGYRGLVGSVLLARMAQENDFEAINTTLLSTSQAGEKGPLVGGRQTILGDAGDMETLAGLDVILSAQGSDYTKKIHPRLRANGWAGYWIDSASALRYKDSSVLVLDPLNREVIDRALEGGKKDFIGANCTTATMLIGLAGLFKARLVETANPSTYQAVSGAGARKIAETLSQMKVIPYDPNDGVLTMLDKVQDYLSAGGLETAEFGAPIAGNVIPLIDDLLETAQSREEWKAGVETRKILGNNDLIVDGTCVRVASLRSHAQVVNLKLTEDLPIEEIRRQVAEANQWVDCVPDDPQQIKSRLTPLAVSGSLTIAVGRLRKLANGPKYVTAFVVGDQLLWGAAEPLRRMLRIVAAGKVTSGKT